MADESTECGQVQGVVGGHGGHSHPRRASALRREQVSCVVSWALITASLSAWIMLGTSLALCVSLNAVRDALITVVISAPFSLCCSACPDVVEPKGLIGGTRSYPQVAGGR